MKDLVKQLRESRKEINKAIRSLPKHDAYCMVECILLDTRKAINLCLKDLASSHKEARTHHRKNP